MARLTDINRADIMADFHAGITQHALAKKYEVSKATINKLCKGIEPKNADKVNALSLINIDLASQSEREVNAVNKEVAERTKHIQFFNNAAVTNVKESLATPCENQNDFRARAETISKGKEVVLGKQPDASVSINTTVVNRIERVFIS